MSDFFKPDFSDPALSHWLEHPKHHLLAKADVLYPESLRQLTGSPEYLYVSGQVELLSDPQIAIVGARNMTPYGRGNAKAFAEFFARSGLIVTSGLALGVDAVAHQAALDAGGQTIAVVATGLDQVYPKQNQALAQAIEESGVMVSEFPLGTPPVKTNFPIRNRIISGLSLGTLVVEAAERSGSLITARLAVEQGREVFAIPGSIHNPMSRGCHRLLRHGAKLVESAADILEELAQKLQQTLDIGSNSPEELPLNLVNPGGLDADYRSLLESVGYEATSVDRLIGLTGLKVEEVASMLLMLELDGHIESVPGGYMRV